MTEPIEFEPDDHLTVWSDSPARAGEFFGFELGNRPEAEIALPPALRLEWRASTSRRPGC
jgi:hypothetical protein